MIRPLNLARYSLTRLPCFGGSVQRRWKGVPPLPYQPSFADSFPLVLAVGGGLSGLWLAFSFKDSIAWTGMQGHVLQVLQFVPVSAPALSCTSACFTWVVASSPMRLAAVETQVRAAHHTGRSIVWVLVTAGGAAGARALFAQMAFFGVHGMAAFLGFAGKTMGFSHPLSWLGMLTMSIGPVFVLAPIGLVLAILTGSVGMGAGSLVGLQLRQRLSSSRIGLDTALGGLRGMSPLDNFLARFRTPLTRMLWWSPLLSFVAVFLMSPAPGHVLMKDHPPHGSGPDFSSRQDKFTVVR